VFADTHVVRQLWLCTQPMDGAPLDTPILSLRTEDALGVSPTLVAVLADPAEPEVARLRAFGCIATALACSEISLVSAHRTSEGVLEYRRCRCGTISMVRDGHVVGRVHTGR
jgi:hypothetical protein